MGLIFDLAVAVLALVVVGSLATLAWTFAVSAVCSVRSGRQRVARARRRVVELDARLAEATARTAAQLGVLVHATASRTSHAAAPSAAPTSRDLPGERPDE